MGNDDAHLAVLVGHLEHVADEGPVALALGRNAAPEAVVGVVGRLVGAPLFEREGGLATTVSNFISASPSLSFGLRSVSPQRMVALSKPWSSMFIMASAQVLPLSLLTVEREVVGAHLAACLDEQGTRAARRVADARAGGAFGQPSQQGRNLLRREELSSLLPGVAGELLDKEHIGIADDVVVREV